MGFSSAEEKQCTNRYVLVMKGKKKKTPKQQNFKNTSLKARLELFPFKIIQAEAVQE